MSPPHFRSRFIARSTINRSLSSSALQVSIRKSSESCGCLYNCLRFSQTIHLIVIFHAIFFISSPHPSSQIEVYRDQNVEIKSNQGSYLFVLSLMSLKIGYPAILSIGNNSPTRSLTYS